MASDFDLLLDLIYRQKWKLALQKFESFDIW